MRQRRSWAAALVGAVGLAASLAWPAMSAEDGQSFKRIGIPERGAGKRITIQIDPEDDWYRRKPEPQTPAEETADAPAADAASDVFAGFWRTVSPSLADAGAGRLETALAALGAETGLPQPRLEDMRRITDVYGRHILRHTVGTRVSPALVAAIISVESAGRADAVSSAGARGVMQLMPATAERFGVSDWREAEENIRGGIAYLDWLAGHFGQDPVMMLAGYNAGEGAVRKHEGVPPYAETRAYVPKVLAAWKVAAGLCRTPPQLLSDGCVFVGPSS